MIRTALSFCLLFGGLLLGSKWLHQSASHAEPAANQQPLPKRVNAPAELPSPRHPVSVPAAEAVAAEIPAVLKGESEFAAPCEPTSRSVRLVNYDEDPLADLLNGLRSPQTGEEQSSSGTRSYSAAAYVNDESLPESSSERPEIKQPRIVITPELAELRSRLRQCLAYYYFRPENVALRSPWGAMHAMIAYGVDSELIAGDRRVNAIGYLCYNGVCNGQQLFFTSGGRLQTRIGPGVQGHPAQFLAMLAQSRVKTDFPMLIDGQRFAVADLIQHEKETCRPRTELTFKLIAFMHYLRSDEHWRSNDGQDWDIPRLIKEELAQPIVGAACGGTHRMTGFSYAVRKREQRGEPMTGQWLRAKKFVDDFHEYTFRLQNPDGSFSTDWFAGRADFGPPTRRLETTGHITEWLAYSLDSEQLVEPRMIKSVGYLTNLLIEYRDEKWGIGPLGHGLHALAIYDERVFGGQPGSRAVELAEVRAGRRGVER